VTLLAAPASAIAFQIETSQTSSCHEEVTLEALDEAGWPDDRDPPPLDETGERIADDVPFSLPDDRQDLWTIAMLIGNRYNDVRALDPFDLPRLAELHGDPDRQPEHCIRRLGDDGPEGDAGALAACRRFVLDQVEAALGEEIDDGEVDMDALIDVDTHLVFRGRVEVSLPAYPFHVGRALHAMQDSFTHTFRNHEDGRIRTVLNWVEGNLDGSSDEAVNGHPHVSALDTCDSSGDDQLRRDGAVAASAALLEALGTPGSRAERLARAGVVLDEATRREPGCTVENDYCDSPEASLSTGCAAAGGGSGSGLFAAGLLGLAALGLRRGRVRAALRARARAARERGRARLRRPRGDDRRAGPARRLVRVAVAAAVVLVGLGLPRAGSAQSAPDEAERERREDVANTSDEAAETTLEQEERTVDRLPDPVVETWGAALNVGAAVQRGAGNASLGVRWNPWRDLGFGLDVEYNPWVSVSNFEVAPGAASLYVPVIWRLKRFGTWELRTTAYAGATMILFDLVGVDKNSVGLFAGINPLGLALPLGAHTKLVVKPGDIVISAPQLRGIPFYYSQYRFTFGLEWYP
jgi:hypothetical protein